MTDQEKNTQVNQDRSHFLINAKDIGCTYKRGEASIVAIESATCNVMPKERIALVGRSGSGKSTLIQILGGLEVPTKGDISWPSFDSSKPLRPTGIGIIFQMPSLLPALSVLENVALPLILAEKSQEEAEDMAFHELKRLGIEKLIDKLPEELSGGQAQRVAAARIMATKPKLILADEPTGQLDHPTAHHFLDVLFESLEGSDTALLIATHDMEVAKRMKKVWRMEQGILEVIQ